MPRPLVTATLLLAVFVCLDQGLNDGGATRAVVHLLLAR
jgi:hypothetical protein